jgi:CRP/FNR family transcriptional regulator
MHATRHRTTAATPPSPGQWSGAVGEGLEALLLRWPPKVLRPGARETLFRAGQPRQALYYVRQGCFRTSVLSEDGREKITGFRLRGDLLALDAIDMASHACDAIALEASEVWELPCHRMADMLPEVREHVTAMLAAEIRRDWRWMLAIGTLGADQRVVAFLMDLSARFAAMGLDPDLLQLRMTRAELGNFLSLTLETVTRALSRMQARGLVAVDGRRIRLVDRGGLQAVLAGD